MTNRTNITTPFAQRVIQEARTGCANLGPGTIREAKKLCDPQYWHSLTAAEQKQAGKVIAEAVKRGLLPLVNRGLSSEFHLLYGRLYAKTAKTRFRCYHTRAFLKNIDTGKHDYLLPNYLQRRYNND